MLDTEQLARDDTAIHAGDSELVAMIKELLETRIRPAVQEDGGDIHFVCVLPHVAGWGRIGVKLPPRPLANSVLSLAPFPPLPSPPLALQRI